MSERWQVRARNYTVTDKGRRALAMERLGLPWPDDEVPERCQVEGCAREVQTWCPLCAAFLCHVHDVLPDGHACLSG